MSFVVYGDFPDGPVPASERDDEHERMTIWVLRAAWVTLPLTAGAAASDALHGWSAPTTAVAHAVVWAAWAVLLVAVLAPRPLGLTALRAGAPLLSLLAVVVAVSGRATTGDAAAAVAATGVAFVLAVSPAVSRACANGAAYASERRFPLEIPPALFLGPLPLAVALTGAGVATGPLLLAAGRVGAGIAALVVGLPLAALLLRSLHELSRRWAVLVPAGLVVVDPMTLADPLLFTRHHILGLAPADFRSRPAPDELDLRLGAARGSIRLTVDEGAEIVRARRGRHGGEKVTTVRLLFAASSARKLLAEAGDRRIPVG
jgi:hypothetical protein